MAERDIQLIEDSEATDFEKVEEENSGEALKAIRKRKEALDWRIRLERNKVLDPYETPERIEVAKKQTCGASRKLCKNNRRKLGVKSAALEKEIKNLQMDREALEKANKEDMQILKDENATPEDKEAAEERIETRNEEIRTITARPEEIDGEKPLLERVKDIFKKYGLTLTAIILAAGTTIGAVIGVLTRGLKATGRLREMG